MAGDRAATILVVGDDATIQDRLQEVLSDKADRGYRAADGLHGLRLVAADQPDVALFNMGILPSSGADVLGRPRDGRATTRIPVLAPTGRPFPAGDAPRGLVGWIERPFDTDALLGNLGERQGPIAVVPATAGVG